MKTNNVGVTFTHNEPSVLTLEEKVLRAKIRVAEREAEFQQKRALRLENSIKTEENPAKVAAAEVELGLAREAAAKWGAALAELQVLSVN